MAKPAAEWDVDKSFIDSGDICLICNLTFNNPLMTHLQLKYTLASQKLWNSYLVVAILLVGRSWNNSKML